MMLATLGGSWLRGVYLNNGHLGHWDIGPGRHYQATTHKWFGSQSTTNANHPRPWKEEKPDNVGCFDSCFSLDIYVSYISKRQAHKSGATKYEQLYQSIRLYLMICYFPTARVSYLCNVCVATRRVNIMNSR